MSFLDEGESPTIKGAPTTRYEKILKDIDGKFSAIFSGDKGTSKSTTAYSINGGVGTFVVLDFDGNTKRVLKTVLPPELVSNFTVYNIKEMIDYTKLEDAVSIPPQAYKVYEKVEKIIYEEIPKLMPNFIIFDGFQRWIWICEMAMRDVHMKDLNPFTDGGKWNMWKERNFYVDRSYQGAKQLASDAVLFTVHEIEKPRMVKNKKTNEMEEKPYKMPQWLSTVKEETDIVVECNNRSMGGLGVNTYEHYVRSNKVTGIETMVDITGDPELLWIEILGRKIKPLIGKKRT